MAKKKADDKVDDKTDDKVDDKAADKVDDKAAEKVAGPYDHHTSKIDAVAAMRKDVQNRADKPVADPGMKELYPLYAESWFAIGDEEKDRNYLSGMISKLRKAEGTGGQPAAAKKGKPLPYTSTAEAISAAIKNIDAVREAATTVGGIDVLAKQVETVSTILDKVGGDFDDLGAIINLLKNLLGSKEAK